MLSRAQDLHSLNLSTYRLVVEGIRAGPGVGTSLIYDAGVRMASPQPTPCLHVEDENIEFCP